MSTSYQPTEQSRIRRKPDRGSYDRAEVHAILDAGVLCHVGYAIDGQAFVTPTAYWRQGERLYWHGSAASRMLRAQAPGLAVCVAVSHLDGFVLARSGFSTSIQYRSVMAFGRTAPVVDREAKRQALNGFIDRLFPGRARELRALHEHELNAVSLMSMEIETASAKRRSYGVQEKEEADYAHDCWAGAIPIRTVLGAIEPDPRMTAPRPVPANLAAYAEGNRLDQALTETARSVRPD